MSSNKKKQDNLAGFGSIDNFLKPDVSKSNASNTSKQNTGITDEAFSHLGRMMQKPSQTKAEPNYEVPPQSNTPYNKPSSQISQRNIQVAQVNAVAGFLDSNGVFHPLQPTPPNTQQPSNAQSSNTQSQPEPPLKVEDKLNCPCLNCKLFGNHNPTQKERQAVLITYAQMLAAGIFILGILIIVVKLYIL